MDPNMSLLVVFIISVKVLSVYPECFTAVVRIKQAFEEEQRLLTEGALIFKLMQRDSSDIYNGNFKRLINDATADHEAHNNGKLYLDDPLTVYHLVRRLSHWRIAFNRTYAVSNHSVQAFLAQSNVTVHSSSVWAGDNDVKGAALALIRLRELYNITFEDLCIGNIKGVLSKPFDFDDIFDVAKIGLDHSELPYAVYFPLEWMIFVQHNIENGAPLQRHTLADVYFQLAKGFIKFDDRKKALAFIQQASIQDPENQEIIKEENEIRKLCLERCQGRTFGVLKPPLLQNYQNLCREEVKNEPTEYCYHKTTAIPYRPADVEILHRQPEIIVFHHVLHSREIEVIKTIATKSFNRSKVLNPDGSILSDARVSQSAWLTNVNETIRLLSLRIELLSGLSTKSLRHQSHAEDFQVLNYGIGGMYEPHYDTFDLEANAAMIPANLKGSGHRLATWMFYLSDVKLGGATVFPKINVRIPVTKGAAAFWYNLHRNGSFHDGSLHAGCPVLVGSKWVANKWIHEVGQQFRRPCSIKQFE